MHRSLLLALFFLALPLAAQSPAADWLTIETKHFRVHYPREYEEWAQRAAERLESIRTAVTREVGFAPPQVIDVIVMNPVAEPNGSAWPLLDTPRMIFFTEPPGPDEQLGAYGHWIDLLAVHETAHVVHMLRPTRNALGRLLERSVLPLNPITLRAPRWVLEGYATVIEGRLTGAGRPTSTIRALILRRWAENGRLPPYAQLNSDRRFLGMSMAYLMGSAFLEWLEERGGPESLRNLWARMTARHRRTFAEAFTGVFGESPDRLYGQFVAELTASSLAISRASEFKEGDLFQETTRASGDPVVSPDGTKLALVVRGRDVPPKLVVWSTAAPDEEERRYGELLEKILRRDPLDVAPVRTKPLPRKALHSLVMPDGGDIENPRWTRDGNAIVFSHRMPDAEGFLHFDLFRWSPEEGDLQRITRLADVRDADPFPDGRTAVAVRSRYGASQLVRVDLASGDVSAETDASIDAVVTHPRVSPDGRRVAHVAHRGGRWMLYVDGEPIDTPGDAASPEWISNDELVVTLFSGGFAELYRVTTSGNAVPVTRAAGGAFQPAPSPDGRLFFMSLNPDGYVVRVIPSMTVAPTPPAFEAALIPAIPPPAPRPVRLDAQVLPPARPYGIGRQELGWLTGLQLGPDQQALEAGVRIGDVIGRLDTIIIGSVAREDGTRGAAIASAWRGTPVALQAHLFATEHDRGAELRASWSRRFPLARLTVEGGALDDQLLFASTAYSTFQIYGRSRLDEAVRLELDDRHYRAVGTASFRSGSFRVAARYQRDRGDDVTLGGLASSLLPRSAYALRVLDPALPVALLEGDAYDGWRVDATFPGIPFNTFYQRHQLGDSGLSLAGIDVTVSTEPFPIVGLPGLDLTAGAAYIFDAPLRGETNYWVGMRWRP